MEVIKAASEWAKAEMVSAIIFMLVGTSYMATSLGLWQWANSTLAKALIVPLLVAGALLLGAGISFYLSNKTKLSTFETVYKANPSEWLSSEMARTEKTINTYQNVALKVFPGVILLAVLVFIFVPIPLVRAISIALIAFLAALVLLDSQALKRMNTYHDHLVLEEGRLKN